MGGATYGLQCSHPYGRSCTTLGIGGKRESFSRVDTRGKQANSQSKRTRDAAQSQKRTGLLARREGREVTAFPSGGTSFSLFLSFTGNLVSGR